jgi:XRE family transcriptional regulator, regulator of sulfur utilization
VAAVKKHREVLGEMIRLYRKRAGLSQEKLAEKAELHPTYISHLECGKKTISADALIRIAKALKVRLRDLVWEV